MPPLQPSQPAKYWIAGCSPPRSTEHKVDPWIFRYVSGSTNRLTAAICNSRGVERVVAIAVPAHLIKRRNVQPTVVSLLSCGVRIIADRVALAIVVADSDIVPIRIGFRDWIVLHISVEVPALRILRVSYKTIGTLEPPHIRPVVPCPEVVEP